MYCPDCGLQFTDPMEDPGGDFYRRCGLYEDRSVKVQAELPDADWRFRTGLEQLGGEPDSRLLDIGCGDGGFISMAARQGLDVYGLDLDERAVELVRTERGLDNVRCGAWTDLRAEDTWREFDAVTMFDVLEHLSQPLAAVSTAHALLKRGGRICITVPRLDRFPRIFDAEADVPPHHLTLWTPRALTALLEKAGFESVEVIEKPLTAGDFTGLMIWRLKRLRKNMHGSKLTPEAGADNPRCVPVNGPIPGKLIRSMARICFGGITLSLRSIGRARGHTLLVIGTKGN